ncbi:MAG: hypothetical protein AMXMBFR13_26790 [Phycisphaerae bacterium]
MVICLLAWPVATFAAAEPPAAGQRVDLAAHASPLSDENSVGVEWENPRDVHEIHVFLPEGKNLPAGSLRAEWWGSVWPANGSGGWMRLGDAWNGQWVPLPTRPQPVGKQGTWVFQCPPLTKEEWKDALAPGQYADKQVPTWRRTLKVRVLREDAPLPAGTELAVYGASTWREGTFELRVRLAETGKSAGGVELLNGHLLSIASLPATPTLTLHDQGWTASGNPGDTAGASLRLLYAENPDRNAHDLTRVTIRLGGDPRASGFSFVPQDVPGSGAMELRDLGASVSRASNSSADRSPEPRCDGWDQPVRLRVADRPEATYESAMAGMPRLQPLRWVPLGVPSGRQEVVVSPNGDWSMWRGSLHTPGRDSTRIPFRYDKANFDKDQGDLDALLDTRPEPKFDGTDREAPRRYLEQGHLPLIHCEWNTGSIHYHHALMATILLGDIGDDDTRRGDETVVLLTKLQITNKSDQTQPAFVHLRYAHDAPLALQDDGLLTILPQQADQIPAGMTALRGMVSVDVPTGGSVSDWRLLPAATERTSAILAWTSDLKPHQTRTLYFKAPYVDLLEKPELERLKTMSFEEELPRVLGYWRGRLAGGMQIEVPDGALNELYAANLWHNLITTDRDPETGLYNQGVGTFRYRVFANETVMIARSMDMRGEHQEAERFIEPMLHYQGDKPLTGRFSTKEHVFHSAGPYTHGEYAMNHGFTLWGIADHYLFTRDRTYMQRVAPQVVKACDFLIRERRATLTPAGESRLPYHGLAPACALEDVVEYQYWFATNGYFYYGLKKAAEALADIGHPDAARIAAEAESYRRDIEIALREAVTRAAAVRLRDGSFIPYVPSRVYQWRHLTEGWIREALYCALHLATTEVLTPDDPIITWMLDDLEDNIFFSWQSGFNVSDYPQTWFEKGAVTLQPCLLDTPTVYMARGEIKAALRSFWNTYALSIYPDVNCFAEWARRIGQGGGPVYKTSDECRFLMWLRQILIWEDGQTLRLAHGTPRAWLEDGRTVRIENAVTLYGTAGLVIRSEADQGRILARVTLPARNPPREVWLRLRHPGQKGPTAVYVNDQALPAERILGEDIRLWPGSESAGQILEVRAEYNLAAGNG